MARSGSLRSDATSNRLIERLTSLASASELNPCRISQRIKSPTSIGSSVIKLTRSRRTAVAARRCGNDRSRPNCRPGSRPEFGKNRLCRLSSRFPSQCTLPARSQDIRLPLDPDKHPQRAASMTARFVFEPVKSERFFASARRQSRHWFASLAPLCVLSTANYTHRAGLASCKALRDGAIRMDTIHGTWNDSPDAVTLDRRASSSVGPVAGQASEPDRRTPPRFLHGRRQRVAARLPAPRTTNAMRPGTMS